MSTVLKICYSASSRLFMLKETEILSKEGTARGDTFWMAIYGTGVVPLQNMLIDIIINNFKVQIHFLAYADDFSAEGRLEDIRIGEM